MKYHLNPATGEVGPCGAKIACPFGGSEVHFATEAEGRQAYETLQNEVWTIGDSGWARAKKAYETRSDRYVESLSEPERLALEAYVNQDYQEINEGLWSGKVHHLTPLIDSAISKGERVKGEIYRKVPEAFKERLDVGRVLTFRGYSSFTESPTALVPLLHREVSDDARNIVLVTNGAKAAPASSLSHMPQEREWLLPRESTFRVEAVRPRTLRTTVSPLGHPLPAEERTLIEVRVTLES